MADLERVDWLSEQLDITITRQDAVGDPWRDGGRSSETPLPYNLRAAEAAMKLDAALMHCAVAIARDRGLKFNGRAPARFLLQHLMQIPPWPPAPECFDAIDTAIATAVKVIDRSEPVSVYQAPCEVCDGELWTIAGDDQYVTCNRCGVVVSRVDTWDRVDREIAGSIFPASEVAMIASLRTKRRVTKDMVHSMTRRKNRPLEPRGRTIDGHPLFSPADVIARLRAA